MNSFVTLEFSGGSLELRKRAQACTNVTPARPFENPALQSDRGCRLEERDDGRDRRVIRRRRLAPAGPAPPRSIRPTSQVP